MVASAINKIKFYKEKYFASGFELGDIGKDGWFEKLPIVTKKDLKEHFDEFVNPELRQYLKVSTTGGSTGIPTKTGYDSRIPEEVYSWRLQSWFGVNPWDDHAYVWRDTRASRLAKFKNAALWWPTKHLKMDATFITEEGMSDFIGRYNKIKPTMLQGYVGAVTQLAQFVVDKGLKVYSPKFVWTTSAPLPSSQRKLIMQAFGAPVCDQYGSCEVRWIAQQCRECGGLHVNTEHVHIEFVDDSNNPVPKGEYGRTLLTNLEDTVFPLIRYENGDRGRWLNDQCPCGRTLPLIDSVKGRESESFVLPSGKTINGEFLTTIFDSNPDLVSGFRVVQHKDLSMTIEYIPTGNEDEIKGRIQSFAKKIGDEAQVYAKRVQSIPHDRGKLRFVVREI
jgi:phenylacetate-CoA ligase